MKTGFYRHYKGNFYYVIAMVKHSEERQALTPRPPNNTNSTPVDTPHPQDDVDEARDYVLYQALYGDYGLWVRPASMFAEQIPHPTDNNKQIARFEFLAALPEAHAVDLSRLMNMHPA